MVGVEAAVSLAQTAVQTIQAVVQVFEDFKSLLPEAEDTLFFLKLIEKRLKKENLPEDAEKHLQKRMEELSNLAEDLSSEKSNGKSLFGDAGSYLKKLASAPKTRRKMKESLEKVQELYSALDEFLKTDKKEELLVDLVQNEDARSFWQEMIKETWEVPFKRFMEAYKLQFPEALMPKADAVIPKAGRRKLLHALCQGEARESLVEENETVSVFRFNSAVNNFSFPFLLEKMADAPDPHLFSGRMSTSDRLAVCERVVALQRDFSKPEMEKTIRRIIDFMKKTAVDEYMKDAPGDPEAVECSKTAKAAAEAAAKASKAAAEAAADAPAAAKAAEEAAAKAAAAKDELFKKLSRDKGWKLYYLSRAAQEWAKEMKRNALMNKEDAPAILFNQQHREWRFFFEQYMAFWRLVQLSQDMFEDIDFPGTGRSTSFIEFCEPLNWANYHVVIGGEPKTWSGACPKVFMFLRQQLSWKDALEEGSNAKRIRRTPPLIPGEGWKSVEGARAAAKAWEEQFRQQPAPPVTVAAEAATKAWKDHFQPPAPAVEAAPQVSTPV